MKPMSRPTLVMIHGLIGSLQYFDPRKRLPGIRVMTEDLLGYGRHAAVPRDRLTLAAQADHIAGYLDVLQGRVWLLGHSMGGAVAILVADRRFDRVCGVVNVEGNLTEQDTFWSKRIAAKTEDEWAAEYRGMEADPAGWIARCGVDPDPQRIAWAEHLIANQPAGTLYAMAQALLDETLRPGYLDTVRGLLARGMPMHLVAGATSAAAWGVPGFVREQAASYTEQAGVGHLMMLEAPNEFCAIVAAVLDRG
jgi:pimeloyl-ACP methyl ester carboxylesterase